MVAAALNASKEHWLAAIGFYAVCGAIMVGFLWYNDAGKTDLPGKTQTRMVEYIDT